MKHTSKNGMVFINGYGDKKKIANKYINGKKYTLYSSGSKERIDKYFYKYKDFIKANTLYRKIKIGKGKYGLYLHHKK